MSMKFKNNSGSRLANDVLATATGFTVLAGTGINFPELTSTDDYFHVTLVGDNGDMEIVRVTKVEGDVLTCVRAQEDTVAKDWPANTRVENRITAEFLNAVVSGDFGGSGGVIYIDENTDIDTLTTPGMYVTRGGYFLNAPVKMVANDGSDFSNTNPYVAVTEADGQGSILIVRYWPSLKSTSQSYYSHALPVGVFRVIDSTTTTKYWYIHQNAFADSTNDVIGLMFADGTTISANSVGSISVRPEGFIATPEKVGTVKPDGTSIVVDEDGTISIKPDFNFEVTGSINIVTNTPNTLSVIEFDIASIHIVCPDYSTNNYHISGTGDMISLKDNYILVEKSGYYHVSFAYTYSNIKSTAVELKSVIIVNDTIAFEDSYYSIAGAAVPDSNTLNGVIKLNAGDKIYVGYTGNYAYMTPINFNIQFYRMPTSNEYQVSNSVYNGLYQIEQTNYPLILSSDNNTKYFNINFNSDKTIDDGHPDFDITDDGHIKVKKSGSVYMKYACAVSPYAVEDKVDCLFNVGRISGERNDMIMSETEYIRGTDFNPDTFTISGMFPVNEGDIIYSNITVPASYAATSLNAAASVVLYYLPSLTSNVVHYKHQEFMAYQDNANISFPVAQQVWTDCPSDSFTTTNKYFDLFEVHNGHWRVKKAGTYKVKFSTTIPKSSISGGGYVSQIGIIDKDNNVLSWYEIDYSNVPITPGIGHVECIKDFEEGEEFRTCFFYGRAGTAWVSRTVVELVLLDAEKHIVDVLGDCSNSGSVDSSKVEVFYSASGVQYTDKNANFKRNLILSGAPRVDTTGTLFTLLDDRSGFRCNEDGTYIVLMEHGTTASSTASFDVAVGIDQNNNPIGTVTLHIDSDKSNPDSCLFTIPTEIKAGSVLSFFLYDRSSEYNTSLIPGYFTFRAVKLSTSVINVDGGNSNIEIPEATTEVTGTVKLATETQAEEGTENGPYALTPATGKRAALSAVEESLSDSNGVINTFITNLVNEAVEDSALHVIAGDVQIDNIRTPGLYVFGNLDNLQTYIGKVPAYVYNSTGSSLGTRETNGTADIVLMLRVVLINSRIYQYFYSNSITGYVCSFYRYVTDNGSWGAWTYVGTEQFVGVDYTKDNYLSVVCIDNKTLARDNYSFKLSVLNSPKWNGSTKYVSTAAASGGANGDIWFQYIA